MTTPSCSVRRVARLKAESRFTCRTSSKATLKEDIRAMLEIYRVSWAKNWLCCPFRGRGQ